MRTISFLAGWVVILALMAAAPQMALAIEKVKVGTSSKAFHPYNLFDLAMEERGLWKKSGLEAEVVRFTSSAAHHAAMVARHIDMGVDATIATVAAAAAGAPFLVVAHLFTKGGGFYFWVRADSPIKDPKELKGTKIGVPALGSASHVYGRLVAKALGLEKDIKFVGAGGAAAAMAALKAGAVDGTVFTFASAVSMIAAGEIRELISTADYRSTQWLEHTIMVRKDFLDSKPEVVRRTVKVFAEASTFLKENPRWVLERLQTKELLTPKAAQIMYDKIIAQLDFGKVDPVGLENVRNFIVDYGMVAKEKAPAVEALYRNILD